MNAEHTPGPWSLHKLSKGNEPFIVESENGETWVAYSQSVGHGDMLVADVMMMTAKSGYPCVGNREECDANARLIAAAPELLEALIEARCRCNQIVTKQSFSDNLFFRNN